MRRSLEALALAVLFAALTACGGGGEEADTGGEVATEEEAGPAVSPDSAATVTGVVNFTGTAPANEPIDMSEEPTCAEKHTEAPTAEHVVVGDGTLGNVFVYVKDGLGSRTFPIGEPVLLDQDGCTYHPHILGIQAGQDLVIKNSDGILHNINTQPTVNQGFNVSQPVAMETTKSFTMPEIMIPVKCDVHGWMEAYIGVQSHPYMAVTSTDGTFRLENLPPGTYTIEAWHERYGTLTQTVTVGPQESGEVTFEYSADMAGRRVPMAEPIDLHDHGSEQPVAHAGR